MNFSALVVLVGGARGVWLEDSGWIFELGLSLDGIELVLGGEGKKPLVTWEVAEVEGGDLAPSWLSSEDCVMLLVPVPLIHSGRFSLRMHWFALSTKQRPSQATVCISGTHVSLASACENVVSRYFE